VTEPTLSVVLNGDTVIEYQRSEYTSDDQQLFLDKMDRDMRAGINIGGEYIEDPDENERINYVAMKLIQAILTGNEALITAMCAYISNRYFALEEIQAEQEGDQIVMTFIFN